ncbi:MAG: preprotein translocase subunit SecE [Lachnospiraceae bacterium]|nr:preprotein translocase subunit SecE [Lachnospiraceae bacterium]
MSDSSKKENKTKFFDGVSAEFNKVDWPNSKSTFRQSVAVVVISVIFGLIIAFIDYAAQFGVNFLTGL